MTSTRHALTSACALALMATPALAHPGHDGSTGYIAGFLHPITGTDHLLAIVSVGVIAGLAAGRARIAVPAAFIAFMALGGMLGMNGLALPFVEPAIAVSVVVLGLLMASGARIGLAALVSVAAIAAIFHGAAHGGELPAGASGISFSLGFLTSTGLMLAAGLAAGLGMSRYSVPGRWVRPLLGLGTATAGVSMLVS